MWEREKERCLWGRGGEVRGVRKRGRGREVRRGCEMKMERGCKRVRGEG